MDSMPQLERDTDLESINEGATDGGGDSERGWGSQVALRKEDEERMRKSQDRQEEYGLNLKIKSSVKRERQKFWISRALGVFCSMDSLTTR